VGRHRLDHDAGWLLLTITAISLGAPFWFDTLGRLSRLRSSGKPETPLPATGSGSRMSRARCDEDAAGDGDADVARGPGAR
jgi:hypothetical protein